MILPGDLLFGKHSENKVQHHTLHFKS